MLADVIKSGVNCTAQGRSHYWPQYAGFRM